MSDVTAPDGAQNFYEDGAPAARRVSPRLAAQQRRLGRAVIEVPVRVMHGDDDPLVPIAGAHSASARLAVASAVA